MELNLLTEAIQTKNLAQVPQELKLQKTGDEQYFCLALEDKKIINSSLEDIKNVLKYCMIKIGLRSANFPNNEEKAVLIDHIIKEFGGHTCKEIKLAFDMAISNKLEGVDANCYENFSCLYFSKIMNAYRIWAHDVYEYVSKLPKKVLQIDNKRLLTDLDMENWLEETKKVVTDESKIPIIPIDIYCWLIKTARLKISKQQRVSYLDQAIKIRHQQLVELTGGRNGNVIQLKKFNTMRKEGLFEGYESTVIKNIAKRISVYYYLKKNNNEN